ncbi:hypothetical protein FHX76_001232 [Lysinibacter cavernae]|uniref:Uncharacterized protein n=1 Tax=Lysinibacter cavernae TaxID=1640652 RepID=A0A7X5TTD0_9MICO|nr:hypothetical protein [Lysinibacter cavernae]
MMIARRVVIVRMAQTDRRVPRIALHVPVIVRITLIVRRVLVTARITLIALRAPVIGRTTLIAQHAPVIVRITLIAPHAQAIAPITQNDLNGPVTAPIVRIAHVVMIEHHVATVRTTQNVQRVPATVPSVMIGRPVVMTVSKAPDTDAQSAAGVRIAQVVPTWGSVATAVMDVAGVTVNPHVMFAPMTRAATAANTVS